MKILAVTVVFNPSAELLLRSVASYAGSVDRVLVWRNSPLDDGLEEKLRELGCALAGDGSNAGISHALNAAWREAVSGGFDALLTMDQDSVWHGFGDYLAAIIAPDAPEGFYSPVICQGADFEGGSMPGRGLVPGAPEGNGLDASVYSAVDTAFTSGMLIPLKVLERVGGWDEEFLVDGVDNEFCLHALSLGIRCWKCGAGRLEHQLGRVEFKRFLGMRFRVYNYPPERLYGIYRNNLIAIKRYPEVSGSFRRQFLRGWALRMPVRILLGESNRSAKFRTILRGVRAARKK